jgi:hypothetical protein
MDQLLLALQKGDEKQIDRLATQLFITRDGRLNVIEASVFQRYAPCIITVIPRRRYGYAIGKIMYNDKLYTFG